jgi:hypothetical protein
MFDYGSALAGSLELAQEGRAMQDQQEDWPPWPRLKHQPDHQGVMAGQRRITSKGRSESRSRTMTTS